MAFPFHDPIAGSLSAVAYAKCCLGYLADPEKLLTKLALRNFVIDLFLNAMDSEDSFVGLGVFGDDLVIGLDLGRLVAPELQFGRRLRRFLLRISRGAGQALRASRRPGSSGRTSSLRSPA